MREDEIATIKQNEEIEECEKGHMIRAKKSKSIHDVLEEVELLIDAHFFDEFSGTKSASFLNKLIDKQGPVDIRLLRKAWRTLNCSPKTMKVIREIQENLLCVGKRKALITKKSIDTKCWCSKTGAQLNARHIISCCRKG